jgi:glycogen synthase
MPSEPTFSIVINTDGRAKSLTTTLESLRYLDYPRFEVCVVPGPTADGTAELLARWPDRIKFAACPERNLSISRNIGIAMAAGEIVAFIDDDAVPEAEWLSDLAPAFDDPRVGGAGGIVYDHTGAHTQYRFSSCDRLGRADIDCARPAENFNFPFSERFPYLQGTNAAFRRSILQEVGGFDEEYEFYLDETDLCCRIVDAGYILRQLPSAFVHHKYLPSAIRNEYRVTRHRYAIVKNKIYFSLVNDRGHHGSNAVLRDAVACIDEHARDVEHHVKVGHLSRDDLAAFREDAERAWKVGLARGLSGQRRLIRAETLAAHRAEYQEFRTACRIERRRTYCLISHEYPPMDGGIGRYFDQLARSIASFGHHVHVLTEGAEHDRVDFEDGVWIHRIVARRHEPPVKSNPVPPQRIWDRAATMLEEVEAIACKRHVDCVYAPIWDCDGLAVLLDGRFPLVTGLQTTLRFWLISQPRRLADYGFMAEFGRPMLALEREILARSDAIHAISKSIGEEISVAYEIDLSAPRLETIPLGLEDWRQLPASAAPLVPPGALRLLFVGRLEARKGIDVLLAAVKPLCERYPQLYLDVVGDDTLPGPDGRGFREIFESDPQTRATRSRVRFHGKVDEKALRGFYRAADIFVAPSRFESFGLVLVEAMMFSKPAIACRVGGMVEIVEDGVSGLLAKPGEVDSLCACVKLLIDDPGLRARIGAAGRKRYEENFTPARMALAVVELMNRAADRHRSRRAHLEPLRDLRE